MKSGIMPDDKLQKEHRNWINGLLTSAQKREWYGKITVEFKRGEIDLVRSEQTMKPPKGD